MLRRANGRDSNAGSATESNSVMRDFLQTVNSSVHVYFVSSNARCCLHWTGENRLRLSENCPRLGENCVRLNLDHCDCCLAGIRDGGNGCALQHGKLHVVEAPPHPLHRSHACDQPVEKQQKRFSSRNTRQSVNAMCKPSSTAETPKNKSTRRAAHVTLLARSRIFFSNFSTSFLTLVLSDFNWSCASETSSSTCSQSYNLLHFLKMKGLFGLALSMRLCTPSTRSP